MTPTVLNTIINEVENKIPVVTDLPKKTDYDENILETEGNYFPSSNYNKFTSHTLDAKIKPKELANKSDISNLAKNSDL